MTVAAQKKISRPAFRRYGGLVAWAKRVRFENRAALFLAIGAVMSGGTTYATFSNVGPFTPTPTTLYGLLLFNLVLLLLLGVLVARQLVQLWAAQQRGTAAVRLHRRIVTLFSLVAITPTITVAVFSALFFEFGLQAWFSDKVETVLSNSQSVGETYIREHIRTVKADILGMANDLNSRAMAFSQNPKLLDQALTLQARALGLSEALIINQEGLTVARASATLSLFDGRTSLAALDEAARGKVVFFPSQDNDDRIRVLIKLDGFINKYLYISRLVDLRALNLVKNTADTRADYELAKSELSKYRLWFNLTFIVIALLVLFAAVWMGLRLASKLMKPIDNLVAAADRVGKGDLSARAKIRKEYDDLGGLTKAFNKMTWQLQNQQKDLMSANEELEERRRFTETVLSGVSAGIMALDPKGTITLPNRSAAAMMGLEPDQIKGKKINKIMPEAAEMFKKVRAMKGQTIQDQIAVTRAEVTLNLLVRITAEMNDGSVEGYVMTFDDITDQVAAQRTAAWADVAQRIAHEIKNPLTPIQLAAERLKRKYLKEISTDPEIFSQCTDTIIRQVGGLRQMVDEFSSFARMPTPVMGPENLGEVIRQAVFLMEVAHRGVDFEITVPEQDVIVECDARQIGQALTNLIKNAAEAMVGGKGRIGVCLEGGDNEWRITVQDNGRGLPEGLGDRLTEPYVTTRSSGTGLGLAIVKKIMKDHDGDLILENAQKQGAIATLVFHVKGHYGA